MNDHCNQSDADDEIETDASALVNEIKAFEIIVFFNLFDSHETGNIKNLKTDGKMENQCS